MRTFTVQDGVVTPGLAARQFSWGVDLGPDTTIEVDQQRPPTVADARILRASFSREPLQRPIDPPRGVDWRTWEKWLKDEPSLGLDPRKYYVLTAERPDDMASASVLAMFQGSFRTEDLQELPKSTCYQDKWRIVQVCPGLELIFTDGSRLVFERGAEAPEFFTWRQYALRQARNNGIGEGEIVRCVQLTQDSIDPREKYIFTQSLVPGLPVASATPLGDAVVIGTEKRAEWLPVLGALPEGGTEVMDARLTFIGERVIRAPKHDQHYGDKHVRLFGLTPCEPVGPTSAWLVLANPFFYNPKIVSGHPDFIQGENENTYITTERRDEARLALLREGDAIAYTIYGGSSYSTPGEPSHVLHVQAGQLLITPYTEWRVADMNARPEYYLGQRWGFQQSTLACMPPDWVGARVEVRVGVSGCPVGELIAVTDDHVLLNTDWETGQPTIRRLQPLWLTHRGDAFRRWPAERQVTAFKKIFARRATFRWTVKLSHLLECQSTSPNFEDWVAPVTILELSAHPETGELVLMYGAPKLDASYGLRISSTTWYDTYKEAEAARAELVAVLAAGPSPELLEACKRLPEFGKYRYHDNLLR